MKQELSLETIQSMERSVTFTVLEVVFWPYEAVEHLNVADPI